jgi:biopolymer transport protein ExbB/TolQ
MGSTSGGVALAVFYRWLVLIGLLAFGAYLAQHQGLPQQLFDTDESHLSLVILVLFAISSLDAGRRAWRLGRELETTFDLRRRLADGEPVIVRGPNGRAAFADENVPNAFAYHHLRLLADKTLQHGSLCSQDALLERLENAMGRGHETGWFIADLMVRLGLLGTVIGFIYMLGSVSQLSGVDVQLLKGLLSNMSGGMRIALYTTLTGLGTGILLGLQYRLLDQAVERLLAEIIELSEVDAIGALRRLLATGT